MLNVAEAAVSSADAQKCSLLTLHLNGSPKSADLVEMFDELRMDYKVEVIDPSHPMAITTHVVGEFHLLLDGDDPLRTARHIYGMIKRMLEGWYATPEQAGDIHSVYRRSEEQMVEAWLAGRDDRQAALAVATVEWSQWQAALTSAS